MKISLTSKNNLKYFLILIVLLATLILVAVTNARYETVATLDAQANFPTTVLEISSRDESAEYELEAGEDIKLQYVVTNKKNTKTNNNNLQYYLDLLDTNGNQVSSINIKIRQKPAVEDNATYEDVVSIGYVTGKGYGPIILKNDGTEDIKIFEVFVKANNISQNTTFNLKMQAYAESITNNEYNMVRTADLQLLVKSTGIRSNGDSQLFVYTTTENVAKIIGISDEGLEQLNTLTKLEIPEKYNNLPVTEINVGNSLKNKTNLTEIVIPSSVTNLAKKTFDGCSNIIKITCPISLDMSNVFDDTTNKVEDIIFTADTNNTDGFDYTSDTYKTTPWYYSKDLKVEKNDENNSQSTTEEAKLKTINISFDTKITSIGNYTFKDLERLDTTIDKLLVFDKTLTKIGNYAFNNTNLSGSVAVGKTGVTEAIGENAFDSNIIINIVQETQQTAEQSQEPENSVTIPSTQESQNQENNNQSNDNTNSNTEETPNESESNNQNDVNAKTNENTNDQTETQKEITNEIQNTII